MSPERVAVLGAGMWGTAFAAVLVEAGCDVVLWGRRPGVVDDVNRQHRNSSYLGDTVLPAALRATVDAAAATAEAGIVVVAVPAQATRATLRPLAGHLHGRVLVSLAKGVERGTNRRMSEVVAEASGVQPQRIAVVSGPNLAAEIARREPTATVVAATDLELAQRVADACAAPYFRPYTNSDVVGVEIAGAMKNVIAVCVGMAVGLGFGDNARASLITRGLAETARLGTALGADALTFAGLAGVGDVIVTCTSPLSRNRTFGELLGSGLDVAAAIRRVGSTVEGVHSCGSLLGLARGLGVDVPITETVAAVVAGRLRAPDVPGVLLSQPRRAERD
jgi:glycerol-3-phosphate dehydrogenase (NAD(P)+)